MERRPRMFKNCVCTRIKSTSARFAIIFNKSCALCKGGANCFPCWIWFLTKGCPLRNHGHFILVDKEMRTEQNDSSPCTDKCQTAICRCSWSYLGLPLGNNGFFFPSSFHRMILSHTCTAQNQASGIRLRCFPIRSSDRAPRKLAQWPGAVFSVSLTCAHETLPTQSTAGGGLCLCSHLTLLSECFTCCNFGKLQPFQLRASMAIPASNILGELQQQQKWSQTQWTSER